ncbi:MAG: hypothetical protein LBN34_02550 [Clostridiales Family XIII bacterium]|jgi:hypothetical protein|nr:hypothetical protein [Clostridiales Family XIII bacterium]
MIKSTRKVGIGFITGRKSFRNVLATYLKCWGSRILSAGESVELSLFVAYDLEYRNTQRKDYTNINIELREMLSEIVFIDRTTIQTEARLLKQRGVLSKRESDLLFEKGYAGKRNAILYAAAKQGMDAILFLDDDEYPLAVQERGGSENWIGQQILSTHLASIDEADITCGHHCGYISPIPNLTFNEKMGEKDFQTFIEAISNDIISWDSIRKLMESGSITYAEPEILDGAATEVLEVGKKKFISGSNLCINLRDPSGLSAFYNPPSARGEDTFLSTCLSDSTVLSVPCYTFHDGFSLYTTLLEGVLPEKLSHISAKSKKIVARFYSACIGWVRYKPLLLYITRRDEYAETIDLMRENLTATLPKLSDYFDDLRFMKILDELNRYDTAVEKHFMEFNATQEAWKKLAEYLKNSRI